MNKTLYTYSFSKHDRLRPTSLQPRTALVSVHFEDGDVTLTRRDSKTSHLVGTCSEHVVTEADADDSGKTQAWRLDTEATEFNCVESLKLERGEVLSWLRAI